MAANQAVVFREWVPEGLPVMGKHFVLEDVAEPPSPGEGEATASLRCVSVDPYLRGRMKDKLSYFPGYTIGQPGDSFIVLEVLESKNEKFKAGDFITGVGKWVRRQLLTAKDLQSFRHVVPNSKLSHSVGVLGMPGATAYFGYLDLCSPKEGETLVVSGAAGAVGSLVCQLGKIRGCRVIGIAGSKDKCEYLRSIGCDVALNYKEPNLSEQIKKAAPQGVDQYFDNVSGEVKDAVYPHLNKFARVSVCGAISEYNLSSPPLSPNWDWVIITREVRIEGFLVFRWISRWGEAFAHIDQWMKEGKVKVDEMSVKGLENVVEAFNSMMTGSNTGKMVIEVDP